MAIEISNSYNTLEGIYNSFKSKKKLVPIKGWLKLTKTKKAHCDVLLLNDHALQQDVMNWIENRVTEKKIIERYVEFDNRLKTDKLPDHFAARIINGLGAVSSGQNIFLFFPDCFELIGKKPEHFFGIELIDVWSNVFTNNVFPCVRATFDYQTQVKAMSYLGGKLDKTIYLASVFHEMGHQTGSWRVSPSADTRLKVSQFYLDVFGEIQTDSLLVKNLKEFPEIAVFVVLQRLFWFGRRGFLEDPQSARINTDNDSWISCFIWNFLRKHKAITINNNRWHLDFDNAYTALCEIAQEVELLGQKILEHSSQAEQDDIALNWMKQQVEFDSDIGFLLPAELQSTYRNCIHIAEIPQFQALTEFTFTDQNETIHFPLGV